MRYVVRAPRARATRACDDYGDALAIPVVIDDGKDTVDMGLVNKDGMPLHRVREPVGFRLLRG